jgi:cyclopropane-fatty-acyl-phospholipid synthase
MLPPAALVRLAGSAGIRFNGDQPWDIQVHDAGLYRRILRRGSLGFGEAYMDGWWDSDRLDETMTRLIRVAADTRVPGLAAVQTALAYFEDLVVNRQSRRRAYVVGERHYDIGNDIYRAMLDPTMSYSCGYWREAATLEQAQQAKLELICRKLELTPGSGCWTLGAAGAGWPNMRLGTTASRLSESPSHGSNSTWRGSGAGDCRWNCA